jgi:hypothetical protein
VPGSIQPALPADIEPEASTSGSATAVDLATANAKPTLTLSELLADNEKLIEVIGVFTAVSVFVGQLGIRVFAYALSFLFMTLVVILCIELRNKFPSETDSVKVMLFKGVLTSAILLLLFDFFVDYRDIWKYLLVFPIFGTIFGLVFFGCVIPVVRRTHLRRNKKLLTLVAIAVALGLGYVCWHYAVLLEPSANQFLDAVNKLVSGGTK